MTGDHETNNDKLNEAVLKSIASNGSIAPGKLRTITFVETKKHPAVSSEIVPEIITSPRQAAPNSLS